MKKPKIRLDVSGDEQESNFINATLSVVGEHAVSIAVHLPEEAKRLSQEQLKKIIEADFQPLQDKGYEVEVEIGKN